LELPLADVVLLVESADTAGDIRMEKFVVSPLANIESLLMHHKIGLLEPIFLHSHQADLQRLLQPSLVELVAIDELFEALVVLQRLEVELVGPVVLPPGAWLDRLVHLHLHALAEFLQLDVGLAAGR